MKEFRFEQQIILFVCVGQNRLLFDCERRSNKKNAHALINVKYYWMIWQFAFSFLFASFSFEAAATRNKFDLSFCSLSTRSSHVIDVVLHFCVHLVCDFENGYWNGVGMWLRFALWFLLFSLHFCKIFTSTISFVSPEKMSLIAFRIEQMKTP